VIGKTVGRINILKLNNVKISAYVHCTLLKNAYQCKLNLNIIMGVRERAIIYQIGIEGVNSGRTPTAMLKQAGQEFVNKYKNVNTSEPFLH